MHTVHIIVLVFRMLWKKGSQIWWWHSTATTWWRHKMEKFSAFLPLCAGNWTMTGEFPAQRPVTRTFDGFFDLRLSKRFSKQSRRCWFETPSCSLWRHCNEWHLQQIIGQHIDIEQTGRFGQRTVPQLFPWVFYCVFWLKCRWNKSLRVQVIMN